MLVKENPWSFQDYCCKVGSGFVSFQHFSPPFTYRQIQINKSLCGNWSVLAKLLSKVSFNVELLPIPPSSWSLNSLYIALKFAVFTLHFEFKTIFHIPEKCWNPLIILRSVFSLIFGGKKCGRVLMQMKYKCHKCAKWRSGFTANFNIDSCLLTFLLM